MQQQHMYSMMVCQFEEIHPPYAEEENWRRKSLERPVQCTRKVKLYFFENTFEICAFLITDLQMEMVVGEVIKCDGCLCSFLPM